MTPSPENSKIGDDLICIEQDDSCLLHLGAIYTLAGFVPAVEHGKPTIGLIIKEIDQGLTPCGTYIVSFRPRRFRLLQLGGLDKFLTRERENVNE